MSFPLGPPLSFPQDTGLDAEGQISLGLREAQRFGDWMWIVMKCLGCWMSSLSFGQLWPFLVSFIPLNPRHGLRSDYRWHLGYIRIEFQSDLATKWMWLCKRLFGHVVWGHRVTSLPFVFFFTPSLSIPPSPSSACGRAKGLCVTLSPGLVHRTFLDPRLWGLA